MIILPPSIIEKKRIFILSLTLIFCSSILMTSSSILFALQSVNDNVFTNLEGDEYIVLHDETAKTPFTSSIPSSLREILKQIDGVINQSAEIIQPILLNSLPSTIRGVYWDDFTSLYDVEIIKGQNFSINDKSLVMVGQHLADRTGLKPGDLIKLKSTTNNIDTIGLVSGIFESSNPKHNDEIIAPIILAEDISISKNSFTHIVVKIDTQILSKEKIFQLIDELYEVNFTPWVNNGTKSDIYWNLIIYNYEGVLIHNRFHVGTKSLFLPFGQYTVVGEYDGSKSNQIEITIRNNLSVNIQIGYIQYEVSFEVKNNQSALNNIFYQFYNANEELIDWGFLDQTGAITYIFNVGWYKLIFWDDVSKYSEDIEIIGHRHYHIDLSNSIDIIDNYDILNSSTLVENIGIITYATNLNNSQVYIDGDEMYTFLNKIPYNLANGAHLLTIITNGISRKITFYVNSSFVYLNSLSFSNNSRIIRGDTLLVDFHHFSHQYTINVYFNNITTDFEIKNDTLFISTSSTIYGSVILRIEASLIAGKMIYKQFVIHLVEGPSSIAGLLPNNSEEVSMSKSGYLEYWWANDNLEIYVNGTMVQYNRTHISISDSMLSMGRFTINIISNTSQYNNFNISINPVNNFSEIISLSMNNQSYTLASDIILDTNFTLSYNINEFEISARYGDTLIEIQPQRVIYHNINGFGISEFIIYSKLVHATQHEQIQTSSNISMQIPLIDILYFNLIKDGRIHNNSINGQYNWNIIENEEYSISNTFIQLSPGNWSIFISNKTNNNNNITLNILVPEWRSSILANESMITYLGNTADYNGSFSLIPLGLYNISGLFYYNGFSYVVSDNYEGYIQEIDEILTNKRIYYTDAIYFNFIPTIFNPQIQITINDEDISLGNYLNGEIIVLNSSSIEEITVTVKFLDMSKKVKSKIFSIFINYHLSNFSIEFLNSDILLPNLKDLFDGPLNQIGAFMNFTLSMEGSYWLEKVMIPLENIYQNRSVTVLNMFPGKIRIIISIFGSKLVTDQIIVNGTMVLDFTEFSKVILVDDGNIGKVISFTGFLSIKNIKTNEIIYDRIIPNERVPIIFEDYRIQLHLIDDSDTTLIQVHSNVLLFRKNLVNSTGLLKILGVDNNLIRNVRMIHQYSGFKISPVRQAGNWIIQNFPLGKSNITFKIGVSSFNIVFTFNPRINYLYEIFIEFDETSIEEWIGQGGHLILTDSASLDNFMNSGPLAYVKVIIYTEIVIIAFALIVNVIGVYTGLISESKREIKIARSVGFTKNQIVLALINDLKLFLPFSILIGGIISYVINWIFLISKNVFIFGYSIIPSYTLEIWIIDFAFIYISTFYSALTGLKLEGIK
ncbi:MAG: hypothetical protein INQ03_24395 [Candidatus Heimdallarchaeota archaeon]|nr:hypothetical protein [Candidatus Heimdallarchaeota archaeon]